MENPARKDFNMKYFIGAQIPEHYKNKIEMLRAEFKFFTTEPHITVIPPPLLPDEDTFIKDLIKLCNETAPFKINLNNLGQFGNRVLYISVHSPQLIELYGNICNRLNFKKEKRGYTPHLTIVKKRPGRTIDMERVKKRAEAKQLPITDYTLKSITVFYQPKEHSIYVPYMGIPLN